MRLTVGTALTLALLANLVPGWTRIAAFGEKPKAIENSTPEQPERASKDSAAPAQ